MRITVQLEKSVEENASLYYEKAKKLKKKMEGAKEAIAEHKKKKEKLEKGLIKAKPEIVEKKIRKKEWYEKFRWFKTSEGFLVIGGRDATTNEIVIKKHTNNDDIVFHTDMIGSPFFVIKTDGGKVGEASIKEVADATVTFSKAWKLGIDSTPTFKARPEQFTKEALPGEYVPKGGFNTKGKLDYIENKINLAIGITKENLVMAGPINAIKKNCKTYVEIEKGKDKTSDTAKKIRKKIGGELDDIIRALPGGGCKVKK